MSFIRKKAIVFAALSLEQSPGGLLGGKDPPKFWFFNAFIKAIKELTRALTKLYS